MSKIRSTLFAAIALSPAAANAQVLQERTVSLALPQEIAQATIEACAGRNFSVTATVLDRAGLVCAVLRADRAGPHRIAASRAKAFTAASARNNTTAIMENAEKNPAAHHLASIDGFLLLGGGVDVRFRRVDAESCRTAVGHSHHRPRSLRPTLHRRQGPTGRTAMGHSEHDSGNCETARGSTA